jgi:hypothetical protein
VHPERDPGAVGHDPLDPPVRQVVDVVEAGHVHALRAGQAQQQLLAAARRPGGLPRADDVGDLEHRLLAVAEHRGVDEVGDRLRVERRVPAGDHDRVLVGAVRGQQRDARQVERGQQVGVAQLGRERDAEQVERAHRPVRVDGELRHALAAHEGLEVGPDRVCPLGQHVGPLVEDLVEDLHALVGQPDLVGVRVHQRPPHRRGVPVLHHAAELAADVLDGLADPREQLLQAGPDRRDAHRHATFPEVQPHRIRGPVRRPRI